MKVCCVCKIKKDISNFGKSSQSKDGYRYQCKECRKIEAIKERPKRLIRDSLNREKLLISYYKRHDKLKNRICDLTIDWIKENITNKSCIYCGETEKIGCDRIDNNKGHTMDNVVPCCDLCNSTRSNLFTVSEMLKIGSVIRQIKNDRLRSNN